jgi:hypothetical protein
MIEVRCEGCDTVLKANESMLGRVIACPKCKALVPIERPADEDEDEDEEEGYVFKEDAKSVEDSPPLAFEPFAKRGGPKHRSEPQEVAAPADPVEAFFRKLKPHLPLIGALAGGLLIGLITLNLLSGLLKRPADPANPGDQPVAQAEGAAPSSSLLRPGREVVNCTWRVNEAVKPGLSPVYVELVTRLEAARRKVLYRGEGDALERVEEPIPSGRLEADAGESLLVIMMDEPDQAAWSMWSQARLDFGGGTRLAPSHYACAFQSTSLPPGKKVVLDYPNGGTSGVGFVNVAQARADDHCLGLVFSVPDERASGVLELGAERLKLAWLGRPLKALSAMQGGYAPEGRVKRHLQTILQNSASSGATSSEGRNFVLGADVVPLPGTIENCLIGTEGVAVVKCLGSSQLSVVELATGRISQRILVPDQAFIYAVGGNRCAVYEPGIRALSVYELRTGKRISSIDQPFGTLEIKGLIMGSQNDREVVGVAYDQETIDLLTMDLAEGSIAQRFRGSHRTNATEFCAWQADAALETIVWHYGLSTSGRNGGRGLLLRRRVDGGFTSEEVNAPAEMLLRPDGSACNAKQELQALGTRCRVADSSNCSLLPSTYGAARLVVERSGNVLITTAKCDERMFDLGRLPGAGAEVSRRLGSAAWQQSSAGVTSLRSFLHYDELAGMVALVTFDGAHLLLKPGPFAARMTELKQQYLLTMSRPSRYYKTGANWTHRIEALSSGKPSFHLTRGPEGMRVGDDGMISWRVPDNASGPQEVVVTVATDVSAMYYTFNLTDVRVEPGTAAAGGGAVAAGTNPTVSDPSLLALARVKGLVVMRAPDGGWVGECVDIYAQESPQRYGSSTFPAQLVRQSIIGSEMRISLEEAQRLLLSRVPNFRAKPIDISFGDKYTSKDGGSAGAAFALLMYGFSTGHPLAEDFAMTGDISVDGTIRAVGGVDAKIRGARQAGCRLAIIPATNGDIVYDMHVMGKVDDILGIHIFAAATFDEVLALGLRKRSEPVIKAMERYDTIKERVLAGRFSDPEILPVVNEVLGLCPNHLTAQYIKKRLARQLPERLSTMQSHLEVGLLFSRFGRGLGGYFLDEEFTNENVRSTQEDIKTKMEIVDESLKGVMMGYRDWIRVAAEHMEILRKVRALPSSRRGQYTSTLGKSEQRVHQAMDRLNDEIQKQGKDRAYFERLMTK